MKKAFFLIVACLLLAACGTTLQGVKRELEAGGFTLWYPAEGGIEPGQIWYTDGAHKVILLKRPEALKLDSPSPAMFQTLGRQVSAKISLDSSFASGLLGDAAFSGLLNAGTVKDIKLDFGKTSISRLVLGDLDNEKLPQSYRRALRKIEDKTPNLVLISGVVETSGMTYTFTCSDTLKLQAQAPKIEKAINATFDLVIENNNTAVWKIPEDTKLVIGISPESGKLLSLIGESNKTVAWTTLSEMKQWKAANADDAKFNISAATVAYEISAF